MLACRRTQLVTSRGSRGRWRHVCGLRYLTLPLDVLLEVVRSCISSRRFAGPNRAGALFGLFGRYLAITALMGALTIGLVWLSGSHHLPVKMLSTARSNSAVFLLLLLYVALRTIFGFFCNAIIAAKAFRVQVAIRCSGGNLCRVSDEAPRKLRIDWGCHSDVERRRLRDLGGRLSNSGSLDLGRSKKVKKQNFFAVLGLGRSGRKPWWGRADRIRRLSRLCCQLCLMSRCVEGFRKSL